MIFKLAIGDKKFEVEVGEVAGGQAAVSVNGEVYDVLIENYDEVAAGQTVYPLPAAPPVAAMTSQRPRPVSRPRTVTPTASAAPTAGMAAGGEGVIIVPIPGKILEVHVNVGEHVKRGQLLAIMEAMKMENNILSTIDGVVKEIRIQKGSELATGDVVMVIA